MKLTEEHIVDVYNKLHKELVDSKLSENNDVRNILNDEEFVQRLSRLIETKDMLIYLIFEDGWEYLERLMCLIQKNSLLSCPKIIA